MKRRHPVSGLWLKLSLPFFLFWAWHGCLVFSLSTMTPYYLNTFLQYSIPCRVSLFFSSTAWKIQRFGENLKGNYTISVHKGIPLTLQIRTLQDVRRQKLKRQGLAHSKRTQHEIRASKQGYNHVLTLSYALSDNWSIWTFPLDCLAKTFCPFFEI